MSDFKLPDDVSSAQLYKQAGNSVSAPLLVTFQINYMNGLQNGKKVGAGYENRTRLSTLARSRNSHYTNPALEMDFIPK